MSRLLIKLTVLGAFFFPLSGALRGANNPRQLDIRVQVNGFGAASSQDITSSCALRALNYGATAPASTRRY
jgi:hypothetical protein